MGGDPTSLHISSLISKRCWLPPILPIRHDRLNTAALQQAKRSARNEEHQKRGMLPPHLHS
jgi:hypothetical protein